MRVNTLSGGFSLRENVKSRRSLILNNKVMEKGSFVSGVPTKWTLETADGSF